MVETIESQLTQQQREELSELRARSRNILKTVQLTNLPDFADEGGPDMLIEELVPAEALDFNLHRDQHPTCSCDLCTDFYESTAREI